MLLTTTTALADNYDLAVLDLDGVVYVGDQAVEHAQEVLARVRESMHLAFVTNNAARTPDHVAEHLCELGIAAKPTDVVTSAQAAARMVAGMVPAGSAVFVIGTTGLFAALEDRGLRPVKSSDDDPAAVVQGYGPDMPWSRVVEGAILVANGLPWVASNMDSTIPTGNGVGPGNGALVELVARFSGRRPVVAGKPDRPLFEETMHRVGGQRPLVIGDRLDTDIAGAVEMGWPSLLVRTGVTGLAELVAARKAERPSFIGADLRALTQAHHAPELTDGRWRLCGWSARTQGTELVVEGGGDADDWWRCAAAAAWAHLDEVGSVVGISNVDAPR